MKNVEEQDTALEKEIKDLQRQIGKLSMLLALKKLENDHPALEKLADDIQRARNTLRQQTSRISSFVPSHCGDGEACKIIKAASRILLIGCIGYAISWVFGWLDHEGTK